MKVQIDDKAIKDLSKINKNIALKIIKKIDKLVNFPIGTNIKKLTNLTRINKIYYNFLIPLK